MVDIVNDLKLKEDELVGVRRDLTVQNKKIDELCAQLLKQESTHKETMKRKEEEHVKKLESMEQKFAESVNQAQFLKEQMASIKVKYNTKINPCVL